MQPIAAHLTKRPAPKKDSKTERGEMMQYFLDRINPDRIATGRKPYTMGRMGKMLEAIPTKDLYALKSRCDKAKTFGSTFHFELNPQKFEGRPKPWEKKLPDQSH